MKYMENNKKKIIIMSAVVLLIIIGIILTLLLVKRNNNNTVAKLESELSQMQSQLGSIEVGLSSDATSKTATTSSPETSIVPTTTPQPQTTTDNTAALQQQIDQLQSEIEGLQEQSQFEYPTTSTPEQIKESITYHISDEDRNIELKIGETKTLIVDIEGYLKNISFNMAQTRTKSAVMITGRTIESSESNQKIELIFQQDATYFSYSPPTFPLPTEAIKIDSQYIDLGDFYITVVE